MLSQIYKKMDQENTHPQPLNPPPDESVDILEAVQGRYENVDVFFYYAWVCH